jgi:hypothetical protein
MGQNMHTPFLTVNVNRKEYLENVGVVRIVIFEWIFQKLVVNLLTKTDSRVKFSGCGILVCDTVWISVFVRNVDIHRQEYTMSQL